MQEDLYKRKARLLKEEDEEMKLEPEIMDFKAKKKNNKGKPQEESFPAFQKVFNFISKKENMSSVGPSPGKKRKINFSENLYFWRKSEGRGDTHSKHRPTDSTLRKKFQDAHKQHNREVISEQEGPGGDKGLTIAKPQPGRGTNPEGINLLG